MGYFSEIKKNNYIKEECIKNLDDIIGCIVHDFSNVLTTISSIAQISLREDDRSVIDQNLKQIDYLVRDCKSSLEKIMDTVDGDSNVEKNYYVFDDLIRDGLEICKHKINTIYVTKEKKIDIVEELDSKEILYCNAYDIKHLLMNLVFNGIESIESSHGRVMVKTYNEGDNIVLEVEDNGSGIDDKSYEKLFEPYYTTKGEDGTGLGLSIVQDTLFRQGATLEIETECGQGSRFIVRMPKKQEEQ